MNSCTPRCYAGLTEPFGVAVALLLGSFLGGCSTDAPGGSYPARPIKVVVPFAAGGGSDTFARIIKRSIDDQGLLDQPLVILNVDGAGGTIGSRRVKNAPDDGYTLLNVHEALITAKYSGNAA